MPCANHVSSHTRIDHAVQWATRMLAPRAAAILVRTPRVDPRCPDTSDLDIIVLADIDDMRCERLWPAPRATAPYGASSMPVDLTWLPWSWVNDAEAAAARGWIPHRLLSSDVIWDCGRRVASHCREIGKHLYRPDVLRRRVRLFLDLAADTVREISVTRDFPALGLFWLHMAYAACLAARLDGMRRLCPNIYTRPFDYLDAAAEHAQVDLRPLWVRALRLDVDPTRIIPALRRAHTVIAEKFPAPEWVPAIRAGTRSEYLYWLSRAELEWRIDAALEMARRGESAGAVFYLRFCAYATLRIPMVHARSTEGVQVGFLRPERPVRPEIQKLVPEVIGDLELVLGGARAPTSGDLDESLSTLDEFRTDTLAFLRSAGAA